LPQIAGALGKASELGACIFPELSTVVDGVRDFSPELRLFVERSAFPEKGQLFTLVF